MRGRHCPRVHAFVKAANTASVRALKERISGVLETMRVREEVTVHLILERTGTTEHNAAAAACRSIRRHGFGWSACKLSMKTQIQIGQRCIGIGQPVYVVAEISANHHQDFEQAVNLIRAARDAGADAVKLQTYTPDTITIAGDHEEVRIGGGTLWTDATCTSFMARPTRPGPGSRSLRQ